MRKVLSLALAFGMASVTAWAAGPAELIDAVQANNFTDRSDNFKGMMTFDGFTARVELLW